MSDASGGGRWSGAGARGVGGVLVVFGRRAVMEALALSGEGAVEVSSVHVLAGRGEVGGFGKELRRAARSAGVEVRSESAGSLRSITGEPRHDQGVAACVRLARVTEPVSWAGTLVGKRAARPARVLAIDGVTNPQNVGMLVRAAVGCGMDAVLWPASGTPWVSGLVVKSSASAVLRAVVLRSSTALEGLAELRGFGFRVIGLGGGGRGGALWDHEPPHRAVYVIGSETRGVSEEAVSVVDEWVRIPMSGGVESLNAATAGAVVGFWVAGRDAARGGGAVG